MPTMLCIGIAGYLAANSISGWPWFLFLGLLVSTFKVKWDDGHDDDNDNDD